jgi:hypothetical protein
VEKNMSGGLNVGDIIFQNITFGVPILFIVIIFLFWRYSKKRKEQLDRIEQKLDVHRKKD